jgi:hypothetical protein
MDTKALQLKRKIMRRVYYLFAVRVAKHPITLQLVLFVGAALVFAKLVHVHRVLQSLSETSLGGVPEYVYNTVLHALMRGEVLTLLALGAMIFVALSVPIQVWRLRLHKGPQHVVV